MKKIILLLVIVFSFSKIHAQQKIVSLTKEQLKDKIMGGWAGQTIGVTFGGPYEFRFQGTFIGDYQPLLWYDGYLKKTMINEPGLYDDLYMDLTFVDVFEKYGLDAPVDSFANAFAHADYELWHANQVGRYNILNGITKKVVLEIAKSHFKIEERPLYYQELEDADEAFTTSSTKWVMPIVQVGRLQIGDGRVGEGATKLLELFKNEAFKSNG